MNINTETMQIEVDNETYDALAEAATRANRSIKSYIKNVLDRECEMLLGKRKSTPEFELRMIQRPGGLTLEGYDITSMFYQRKGSE